MPSSSGAAASALCSNPHVLTRALRFCVQCFLAATQNFDFLAVALGCCEQKSWVVTCAKEAVVGLVLFVDVSQNDGVNGESPIAIMAQVR